MDDLISRQAVIEINRSYHGQMPNEVNHRIWKEINDLPSAQPETHEERTETHACDCISRQSAIDAVKKNTFRLTFAEEQNCEGHVAWSAEAVYSDVMEGALLDLPSAQPEPLTDKEQRIFLSAMEREEEVCKQVDAECRDCREPYEDSLVSVCHEITRKVKGALWT